MEKLQAADPQYKVITDNIHDRKIQSYLIFSLDSQGIPFKTVKDHDKMFYVLVVPNTLQNIFYMKAIWVLDIMFLLGYINSLKGKIRFEKASVEFGRHCFKYQSMNLQAPHYVKLHLEIHGNLNPYKLFNLSNVSNFFA